MHPDYVFDLGVEKLPKPKSQKKKKFQLNQCSILG